jgi:hypothetical protein
VAEISKVLFVTLDEYDADYDENIRHFESNSEDTTELWKQKVYLINPSTTEHI